MNWFPVITEENFLSLKTPDESEDEPLEKFQLEEIVDHWLYEIEKKAKKTIKAAENTDVAPLDENDIRHVPK